MNGEGKKKSSKKTEKDIVDEIVAAVVATALLEALFGKPKKKSKKTEKPIYPEQIPKDPLPSHEPDGYWSTYRSRWPFGKEKDTDYAEGREAIADMALRYRQDYPFTFKTSRIITLNSSEDFRNYIERVYTVDLIHKTDNRIRYQLLKMDKDEKSAIGMLCCRCGDCGKIAAGLLHGNPDMGDPAYRIMHRKDWFCCNFGWTFMGGHGYPGGRRMICPECSKVYAKKETRA